MDTGAGEQHDENAGNGVPEDPPQFSESESGEVSWEPSPIAGRYRIGDYLGETRLGRTYRARDGDTDQDVEVTFLAADAVTDPDDAAARLEELSNLRHLHILPLLDWQLDPVPYLVYPAPAMRLQRLIESGVAFTPSQTLLIGLQAAETLHSLRQRGVTHGAINPANCCVDVRGRLRLAEMGVEFLRRPLLASEATRFDAPEAIGTPEPKTPTAVDDAGDAGADAPVEPEPPGVLLRSEAMPGKPADDGSSDERAGAEGDTPASPVESAADPVPDAGGSQPPVGDPIAAAAAADVYSLAVVLTAAAAGQHVAPAEISRLGRSAEPASAGSATARNLARLAPLLAQASATRPRNRLEADELALALRATAEMFPPPSRLDEAFRRAEDFELEAAVPEPEEGGAAPQPGRARNLGLRLVAAAAVIVAGALLVIFSAPGDDTPAHVVPSVAGTDWSQAAETLAASGWEVRRLEVRVPGVPPGEVVGQLPEPGGLLDEGQVIKVQVNLGEPLVVIPADVVGMTVEEAGLRLSEIGLAIGNVRTQVEPAVAGGTVVAIAEMLPELPRGSTVDLVVAVGG